MSITFSISRRAAMAAVVACAALHAGIANAQTTPKVKFVTSEGDFVVELYPAVAPKTVANFLQYVKEKHYNGLVFHRVISSFMVQGGGFDADFKQRATRPPVAHEGQEALSKGGPRNVEGTLAMARTGEPNSATSQFFINLADNNNLNGTSTARGYAVFGSVSAGAPVVTAMRAAACTPAAVAIDGCLPVPNITITNARQTR